MAKQKRDIYQEVTDKFIEALEAGTAPWSKPWKDGKNTDPSMPHNAHTGRPYSGINVMLLWAEGQAYNSNGWLTYRQAAERGAQVMKGEKGSMVTLFKPCTGKDKQTGEDKSFFLLRAFTVFNVEQCDWSAEDCKPPKEYEPQIAPNTAFTDIAKAVGCDLRIQGNRACYIPSADQVHMPHLDQFESEEHFDSTGYHELTHWTGHTSRKDRLKPFTVRFGDEAYAFEELVAEIGSAYMCAQTGTHTDELFHHNASYLQSWLKVLKGDKKAIFTASSQARQANEYILEALAASTEQEQAA